MPEIKENKTIFVRNIPFLLTKEKLEDKFSEFGPIKECFIVKNKETGKSRGFGFVKFTSLEDAKKALESSVSLDGRKILLAFADISKKVRTPHRKPADKKEKNTGDDGVKDDKEELNEGIDRESKEAKPEDVKAGKKLSGKDLKYHKAKIVSLTGLPGHVTEKDVKNFVQKVGVKQLAECKLLPGGGKAHLKFKCIRNAKKAIRKLHNHSYEGTTVQAVQVSKDTSALPQNVLKSSRLIVRNLSFQCTEEQFKKAFQHCGEITEVKIPANPAGKKLGFGFLQFAKLTDAKKALDEMNAKKILGRQIAVDWALSKDRYLNTQQKKDESSSEDEGSSSSEEEELSDSPKKQTGKGKKERKKIEDDDDDVNRDGEEDDEEDDDSDGEEDDNEEEEEEEANSDSEESDEEIRDLKKNKMSNREEEDSDENESNEDDEIESDDNDSDEDDTDDSDSEKKIVEKIEDDKLKNSSDSDSDDDDEEEEEVEDDSEENDSDNEVDFKKDSKKKKVPEKSDTDEGCTLFLRNVSFDTTEEDLQEYFEKYGELEYAKIVYNHETEHSKGIGFVKFTDKSSADKCLADAQEGKITLDGRQLIVALAVSREKASGFKEKKEKEQKDKRNLFLAREGMIRLGTKAAEGLSKADLEKRRKVEENKKQKLKNVNIFISPFRLCVRNIPVSIDDQKLREVFKTAAGSKKVRIKECRIMRDRARTNAEGVGKSLGYGFVRFTSHQHALDALRHTNNNPEIFGDKKRLIVEFSLENRKALETQEKRKEKGKANLMKRQQTEGRAKPKLVSKPPGIPLIQLSEKDKKSQGYNKRKGFPSHSGPKIRHKPRPSQTNSPKKAKHHQQTAQAAQKRKSSDRQAGEPVEKKAKKKKQGETHDDFDKIVNKYKNKLMAKKGEGKWFE